MSFLLLLFFRVNLILSFILINLEYVISVYFLSEFFEAVKSFHVYIY